MMRGGASLATMAGAGRCGRGRNAHLEPVHLRGDLREFGQRQLIAISENDSAEHGVLKLADIAGPIIAANQRQRLGGEPAQLLALFRREAGEEGAGKIRDVLRRARSGGSMIGKTLRR